MKVEHVVILFRKTAAAWKQLSLVDDMRSKIIAKNLILHLLHKDIPNMVVYIFKKVGNLKSYCLRFTYEACRHSVPG